MNGKQQKIILIEPTQPAIAAGCERLDQHQTLRQYDICGVLETDALAFLQRGAADGETPLVVLIGTEVANVAQLTRELQRLRTDAHVVFLDEPDAVAAADKRLAHVPVAGLSWSTASLSEATVAHAISKAAKAAQRRHRFRSTVNRANDQLSRFRAAHTEQHSRAAMSEHYLASFLAHSEDAIVAIDPELKILFWSAGAERLFKRSDQEAVGTLARDLPFWSSELERHLASMPTEQGTVTCEASIAVDGQEVAIESVCSAVRGEGGRFIGSSLIIRDVTQRQRKIAAERAQQKKVNRVIDGERQHLRRLFKQAPGFIAVFVEPEHVVEVVNDAYLQITGHRDIVGKPVTQALPELQAQGILELMDRVYATGEPYIGRELPVSLQRAPGAPLEQLYIDLIFQPITSSEGAVTGIFCQGNDITEHKRTKETLAMHQTQLERLVQERTQQLEQSQLALQRSQKLEAIGQLTGGVAHDFNNVLQIISSNLQLLQYGSGEAEQRAAFLRAAVDAVDRGTKLSSQLLAFARRQPLQPITLNLSRVLRGMDDLLRRALGETIEIETVVAGGLWNSTVDPNQLENVILNLAINARDAMPNGGRLTLELGNAMLDDRYVLSQPDLPAGQYVMLAVSDTGKGMPAEVIERAFDPFFTTKSEGMGTGLGLSMAYGFVKQSGGHIRIYSELGSGTTFKIYLPRSFDAEVEVPRPVAGPVVGGSETVLVVEDDPAVQEAAVLTLKDLGYRVLQAGNGASALNVLQRGVAVDVLFTDVVMPGPVRSTELARQAKQMLPEIAVLFTSGYTQNAIVHAGRLDPGVELLSKPYRREDLARKLRHVIANTQHKRSLSMQPMAPSSTANKAQDLCLRILVVEDDADSQEALCNLLTMLGHRAAGVSSAESALDSLSTSSYELLLTDVNLPGKSGIELVKVAVERNPDLRVIIASGYGAVIEHDLPFQPVLLPKPFDLRDLQEAIVQAVL